MLDEQTPAPNSALLFALSVVIFVYSLLVVFAKSHDLAFPQLPVGSYVGYIRGLSTGGNAPWFYPSKTDSPSASGESTFLVESSDDGRELKISVLQPGVPSTAVELKELSVSESSPENKGTIRFRPLRFNVGSVSYLLYGDRTRASWSGDLIGSDGGVGKWYLERLAEDAERTPEVTEAEVPKWMYYAAANKFIEAELSHLAEQANIAKSVVNEVRAMGANRQALEKKAQDRIPQLQTELKEQEIANAELEKEINEYVKELDLLSRFSDQGKVILLSRRILSREKSWFLASWPVDSGEAAESDDSQGMSSTDLEMLDQEYQQAQQAASLSEKVKREKLEVRRLERSISEADEKRQVETQTKEEEEERSLWDRLFR